MAPGSRPQSCQMFVLVFAPFLHTPKASRSKVEHNFKNCLSEIIFLLIQTKALPLSVWNQHMQIFLTLFDTYIWKNYIGNLFFFSFFQMSMVLPVFIGHRVYMVFEIRIISTHKPNILWTHNTELKKIFLIVQTIFFKS